VRGRPRFWTGLIVVLCLGWACGVARAQINVAVTSSVAITVAAGDSVSNAGSFTVTNSSGSTITISSVNISATGPGIFSSLTLTGQVPGTTSVSVQSSPNPPGTSNTFDFSALPPLPTGQAATFTLSAITSSITPTPTPSANSSDVLGGRVAYAAMLLPSTLAKAPPALLLGLMIGILLMTGQLRRRHLVVLALALILAATELGCGNTSSVSGSSTQQVQTITVSSGGTPTGLPANLGSITVQ